ncbi:hypothetical protein [Nonomuraea sp. NPDC049141]|uniref:hypothetical protein n=1 Tax=unclassified Nonomuraea TaxID=2593643 RepID=UPI0033C5563F
MEKLFDLQLRSLPTKSAEYGIHDMSMTIEMCNTRNCPTVSGATCYQTCKDTCQSPPTVC